MGHPADNYDAYTEHHHEDHNAVLQKKQEQKGQVRMPRHSGNDKAQRPAKGGAGGKTVWGTAKDEIEEGMRQFRNSDVAE